MMRNSRSGVQAKLQTLRRGYAERLGGQLVELARLLARASRASTHEDLAEAAEPAVRLAHRIHGTAASYGLPDVSAEARRIEEGLERLLGGVSMDSEEGAGAGDSGLWTAMAAHVDAAQRSVRAFCAQGADTELGGR